MQDVKTTSTNQEPKARALAQQQADGAGLGSSKRLSWQKALALLPALSAVVATFVLPLSLHQVSLGTVAHAATKATAASSARAPSQADLDYALTHVQSIYQKLSARVYELALDGEKSTLKADYSRVPADELPVAVFQDLIKVSGAILSQLEELAPEIIWDYKPETFANALLHANAFLLADDIAAIDAAAKKANDKTRRSRLKVLSERTSAPTNIPNVSRVQQAKNLINFQVYLRTFFRLALDDLKHLSVSEELTKPFKPRLPRDWFFELGKAPNGLVTNGAYYLQINPDYIRKLGNEIYRGHTVMNRNAFAYTALAGVVSGFSSLLTQRFFAQVYLPHAFDPVVIKQEAQPFFERLSNSSKNNSSSSNSSSSNNTEKFSYVDYVKFITQLKRTLGSDLPKLTPYVLKQPRCAETDPQLDVCMVREFEKQVKNAYRFGQLVEELGLSLKANVQLIDQVLNKNPDWDNLQPSQLYVPYQQTVLDLVKWYNDAIENVPKQLLNFTRQN